MILDLFEARGRIVDANRHGSFLDWRCRNLTGLREPGEERARERAHSRAREAIDDADDVLVAPFAGLVDGSASSWVRRGVPTLLALLVYGFGLSFLARFARGRA